MSSEVIWKLHKNDSETEEFIDIRRKVGNQIIREYLLDNVANNRVVRVSGKLRGPRKEFKDFSKFLILQISIEGVIGRFLAESGVYDNIRIVAVDSNNLAQRSTEELLQLFTDALKNPSHYDSMIVLSDDSTVR